MDYTTQAYGAETNRIEVTILREPLEGVLMGMVRSGLFQTDIALALDNTEAPDYDFACLGMMRDGSAPRIYMLPEWMNKLRWDDEEALTVLFHEIGHYVHRDDSKRDADRKDDARISSVRQGRVNHGEILADDFAAAYIGKDAVVRGLERLIQRIRDRYPGEAENETLKSAIMELELRIEYQRENCGA